MEVQLERLGNAFDQNTDAFSDGLKYLESMTFIFQRVMNDALSGQARCLRDLPNDHPMGQPTRVGFPYVIDFQGYIREYWLCMAFTDFAMNCKRVWDDAHPEQKGPGPILVPEGDGDQIVVFGGG